jgi:hypothetical protein
MRTLHVFALAAVLAGSAAPAAAQTITLEFHDGRVKLSAQNVPASLILAEWAQRGRTTIVNGERVPGPPMTLQLDDVPEQQALDIVLRSASGYLVAARETAVPGASAFDRIFIVPTSSRPAGSTPLPTPQVAQAPQEDFDDDLPPQPPRGNVPPNPGARIPRDVIADQPRPAIEGPDPEENRPPATMPGNPFGVAPGTSRPGVISPGPQTQPPRTVNP